MIDIQEVIGSYDFSVDGGDSTVTEYILVKLPAKAIIFDAIFKDDESTEVIYENRKYYGYLSFDKFDKSYMWGLYNDKYPENSDVRTFKFSYKSFIDYLNHLGFSSIYEVMVPIPANPNALNKTILAIKNKVIREELPLI